MRKTLSAVIRRELSRMTSRRIYLAACIVLPLFSLLFMATIFGDGRMRELPVGVVDADNSSTSRNIVRMVDATPELKVAKQYSNETEARNDLKRKRIYAYLLIPSGFAQKAGNNEEVTLSYYYHNAMLGVGGEVYAAFEQLLKQVSITPIVTTGVALGEENESVISFLIPVTESSFPIYNANRNYLVYLGQPMFFIFLQILLLLVTTYALGSESKFGTVGDWLQTAHGDIFIAVMGKLLPYTCIFILMGIAANYVFFGWLDIPLPNGLWTITGVTILFVCATQALALLLYSLFPALSLIISIVSMVGSLGATLSGVTFPIRFMDTPVYAVSYLFPVRHFMEAVQMLQYTGGRFADYWTSIAALLLFMPLSLLLLPRLKNALTTHRYAAFE